MNWKILRETYVDEHFEMVESLDNEEISTRIMRDAKQTAFRYQSQTRSTSELDDSIMQLLPAEYEYYISSIYELINKHLEDTIEINQEFCKIAFAISNDTLLSNEDKHCLWAVNAVAKYSYKYNVEEILTRSVTFESVASSDVGGAIGGVLTWATFGKAACNGLMFGPGGAVMTVAKAAVQGAIVGSAVHIATGGNL